MNLSRQQKLIILSLIIYWPTLFILAHIPIPQVVREADVSDKVIHFLAYLILTFLLWSAINADKKVNWRKAAAWWILLVVVLYGILDEVLQRFVAGRCCDTKDFISDLTATLTGLIILSIFTFWPAFLVVTGITIFGLTNVSRVNIADLNPVINTVFHLFAYAFFTLLWIQNIHQKLETGNWKLEILKPPKPEWLIIALTPPIAFLLAVKLGSLILGRSFSIKELIVSVTGIAVVVGTISVARLSKYQISK